MDIKVVMLGTAGSSPTKTRGMPSVALVYDGDVFLFDCGEATQMQMLRYGINASKLKAIFISHTHGDHIIGIAGLVRTLALNRRTQPLTIFAPKGYESVVKSLLSFDKAMLGYEINVRGVRSGEVYKGNGYSISAFALRHSMPTCGYIFRENEKRNFVVEKTKKLGIKGEMYSALQKHGKLKVGNRTIKLEDVTTVQHGKSVVYASDTRPVAATVSAARGAGLLIHESSYADAEKKMAAERMHSTALEVAQVAEKAGVKRLLLTHISARYSDPKALEAEAQKVFKNSKVASDGEIIIV